ncbi:MAG TPA: MerR family transcriptional regulator [Anaerolineae bacterium]|nr:MerR family transcriptional regulator [Anaerolineae bacterium]
MAKQGHHTRNRITMKGYLSTSEIANAVGVHPNTVRLYEEWGFLPQIPRSPSGYRLFSQEHLDQMRLARTALHGQWPGKKIRESALTLVRLSASGDIGGALEQGYHHLALVQAERAQAEAAADLLERWAQGVATDATSKYLQIGGAAKQLGVTTDMLRNWERNGLIRVPRDPNNGYRQYGTAELGRLRVIRMLNLAGYSQMAILRMMLTLDQAQGRNLRQVLDTPRPDEDIYSAADRWLSTLAEQEQRALDIISQLEAMIQKRTH